MLIRKVRNLYVYSVCAGAVLSLKRVDLGLWKQGYARRPRGRLMGARASFRVVVPFTLFWVLGSLIKLLTGKKGTLIIRW